MPIGKPVLLLGHSPIGNEFVERVAASCGSAASRFLCVSFSSWLKRAIGVRHAHRWGFGRATP